MPGAALVVRKLVAAAPEARFIVTSRVPLDIANERIVEIGGVNGGDAVELFVERVRSRMSACQLCVINSLRNTKPVNFPNVQLSIGNRQLGPSAWDRVSAPRWCVASPGFFSSRP
jgi:hypothetical protein